MDYGTAALVCVLGMLFFMVMGMPVIYALGFTALGVAFLAFGPSSLDKMGWITFNTLFNINWVPLPLFVLIACLLAETVMGEEIYDAARSWLSRIPGGLIVTSIFGEAVMSAAIGTSTATILAVAKVAEPEFEKFGYDKGFAMGAMACGGTLGPLIPPSTGFIVYGVLAEVSIGHLFIAGMVPGVLLAIILAATAILLCWRNPKLGPPVGGVSWSKRFSSLKRVWPMVVVMVSILGSIYFGVASPTESAGVGCVIVLILGVVMYRLRWAGLKRALLETAIINGMILFMMVGAWLFSYVIGASGVVDSVTGFITESGLSPWLVIVAINILLLLLGCFIDAITIMLLTVPIFVPIITALGFSPVWFGVVYVVNMEIGLITPPMGLTLFFIRSAFKLPMSALLRGTVPFLIALLIFLAIIVAFPELSLWLTNMMVTR